MLNWERVVFLPSKNLYKKCGSTSYVLPIRLSYRMLNRVMRVNNHFLEETSLGLVVSTLITLFSVRYDSRIGST